MVYDRSKMLHKKNILRFDWGEFPAIGIKHFEQRRDERIRDLGTDIFGEIGMDDKSVLLKCFQILKNEKYEEVLRIIERNMPNHTEFVVAFETDEYAEKGNKLKYIFMVFSISIKETAMNGIKQGEKFLSCVTIVKDTFAILMLASGTRTNNKNKSQLRLFQNHLNIMLSRINTVQIS